MGKENLMNLPKIVYKSNLYKLSWLDNMLFCFFTPEDKRGFFFHVKCVHIIAGNSTKGFFMICCWLPHSLTQLPSENSTFLGTGGVEAADLCSASNFLWYHVSKPWLCPGGSTSPPPPGNLSCIPSSHSWGEGMRKMPAALSPHCQWQLVPSSSWGRATSSWDERTGTRRNAGAAVSLLAGD